jgi:hypothetical protein
MTHTSHQIACYQGFPSLDGLKFFHGSPDSPGLEPNISQLLAQFDYCWQWHHEGQLWPHEGRYPGALRTETHQLVIRARKSFGLLMH